MPTKDVTLPESPSVPEPPLQQPLAHWDPALGFQNDWTASEHTLFQALILWNLAFLFPVSGLPSDLISASAVISKMFVNIFITQKHSLPGDIFCISVVLEKMEIPIIIFNKNQLIKKQVKCGT